MNAMISYRVMNESRAEISHYGESSSRSDGWFWRGQTCGRLLILTVNEEIVLAFLLYVVD
jgi:hypothetical protein